VAEEERERAFAHIRQWGDPVLRETARPVETFDDAFAQQVSELAQLMRDAEGAGLAATQVGSLRRVFVYRLPDDDDEEPARVIVNPELVSASEVRETVLEGCLSLGKARVNVDVERPSAVVVDAQDAEGRPLRIEAEGIHARILQHELDHLDGVLMLDHTTAAQRRAAVRALNAGVSWRPQPPATTTT
jgi:peptide deformylase